MGKKDSSSRKRGNRIGLGFFKFLIRTMGINSAYSFLKVVTLYYLLFDREAVTNAEAYMKRRFPDSSKFNIYRHIYKLFISQGKQLVDRYVYQAKPDFFEFTEHHEDGFYDMLQKNKGFIILTSHFGNWQIGLGKLKLLKSKKLNILMKKEINDSVEKTFSYHDNTATFKVVFSDEEFGGILELTKALQNGEAVSVMGDRAYGSKTLKAEFLNETAVFPVTPYYLATTVKCPIIFLYVIKSAPRKYDVYMKKVDAADYIKSEHKKENIKLLLNEYIKELEGFIKKYPYQCFIFKDIWKF
ncbi:MAG: hypothetical protein K9M56_01290 [Victivallales bacterium]|nr:hypothetical protein [Victivallales bacterium]